MSNSHRMFKSCSGFSGLCASPVEEPHGALINSCNSRAMTNNPTPEPASQIPYASEGWYQIAQCPPYVPFPIRLYSLNTLFNISCVLSLLSGAVKKWSLLSAILNFCQRVTQRNTADSTLSCVCKENQ
ncbi:zinc finger protein 283 [Rhinolophus ferrumequinum]|uniref:Zinc finger protein 283 n=1 Tax=Rhinolophus ferrumequinum TaxID=59479 RepID=A0A7J7SMB3_RHIFE|nr:zinc finger protein 283 [Rhinolophus ferrumequinum]